MWGSRIITKSSGPVTELKFDYKTDNVFGVIEGEEYKDLTIESGSCKVGGDDIGTPCSDTENTATISFNDVKKYKAFMIGKSKDDKIPIVAAFMVPECKFEETLEGKVDLKTSAPLTRFVKGQEEVELDFGLRPGDENLEVCFF
ncbi:unnamed protein product [Hymenolepis diminuta]|uniref:DUF5727 domain-containing protein n=1 Tax=Hymenolepis diminuta TaxID=6216 RepID=A0A564Z5G0_HYMDI|nr:unnamed protein product [Hymenolepis diminuta]